VDNPFNLSMVIQYQMPKHSDMKLVVYEVLELETLK